MEKPQEIVLLAGESSRLEAARSNGATWPIVVMEAGFGGGQVMVADPRIAGLPHYFPVQVVAQVAEACSKAARFGRRHPETDGEETDPSRIAGWIDGGRMEGNTARATLHLLPGETELQTKLEALTKEGKLDLLGVSILAYFAWKKGNAEGRDALVATKLARLVSVDLVTEAGAGGKILAYAAARAKDVSLEGDESMTVKVGLETRDKVQKAMDALFGVKEAVADPNVRPFKSLPEAYAICTDDHGLKLLDRGGFYKVSESIATTDFPNILLDSMTKKLIQDYRFVGLGGVERIFYKGSFSDFKTEDRVRMGGLGDLATVNEGAAYAEITKPTDEKVSYVPLKKGGLLTISEETIRNNDLDGTLMFVEKLARAGARTLKQFVTDFFVSNPNYDPDGVALFNAGHTNLGSIALSAAELDARDLALRKQTEKDSGKRLNLPLQWIMVPVDLAATARQINRGQASTNGWFLKFGQDDELIIVNELLSDTNDWYFGCGADVAPAIEVGFLDGIDTPRMTFADQDQSDTQWSNDQIRYKVKFVFGGDIVDFRPVGKNVV